MNPQTQLFIAADLNLDKPQFVISKMEACAGQCYFALLLISICATCFFILSHHSAVNQVSIRIRISMKDGLLLDFFFNIDWK